MNDVRWQPPAHDHVRARSSDAANARIDRETIAAIERMPDNADAIRARLTELDREWHIDRALMLNFAVVAGLSAGMTMRSLYRTGRLGVWGAMFWTQISFLAHHALRGWCPPVPVFRRLGYRTDREICAERVALERRLGELEHG